MTPRRTQDRRAAGNDTKPTGETFMKTNSLLKFVFLPIALLLSVTTLADPPPASGPNVVRFDDTFALQVPDFEDNKQVILGADITEFCNGVVNFDVIPFMEVTNPQDEDRIKQLAKGIVVASVWDFADFDCDRFLTEMPLASGMASFHLNDNDLNVFLRDNQNANSFGVKAHGDLFSPDGEPLKFQFVWHVVWDGVDGEKFFKEIVKISLK
jgi:hypothetical protein